MFLFAFLDKYWTFFESENYTPSVFLPKTTPTTSLLKIVKSPTHNIKNKPPNLYLYPV